LKILVIDDEPLVASTLADALRAEGNDVIVALRGEEGLEVFRQGWPEAVLLDMVMPGMDGNEVLRAMRAANPTLPVVIVSGRATEEQIKVARRLGATDFVAKPIALKNFSQALRLAL
jgi:DNA-binding response OmpR family regulator